MRSQATHKSQVRYKIPAKSRRNFGLNALGVTLLPTKGGCVDRMGSQAQQAVECLDQLWCRFHRSVVQIRLNITQVQRSVRADEVRRVLRPGGVFIYTVRHTGDAHYGPVTRTVTTCSSTVVSPCTSFRDNSSMLWPTAGYSMTCTLSRRAICLGGHGKSPRPNPPQKGGTTRSAPSSGRRGPRPLLGSTTLRRPQ